MILTVRFFVHSHRALVALHACAIHVELARHGRTLARRLEVLHPLAQALGAQHLGVMGAPASVAARALAVVAHIITCLPDGVVGGAGASEVWGDRPSGDGLSQGREHTVFETYNNSTISNIGDTKLGINFIKRIGNQTDD